MSKLRLAGALLLAVGAATVLYGCGEGLVLPDEGEPAVIAIVAGDAQSGTAGSQLGLPLIVRVTDSRGRPVANQRVVFTLENGSGDVIPDTAETDADGRASTSWTLGPATGGQAVQAHPVGSAAAVSVTFNATALSGAGSTLTIVSGDGQSGPVGSALADSLVVMVTDRLGNPVAGVEVDWTVAGGGSIDPVSVTTGADGRGAAERVLGSSAGPQSAQAAAAGLTGSPVTFSHTAGAANPTVLVRISGDAQTAPAGFQLPDSLVVRLEDPNGNGVGGKAITWLVTGGNGAVDQTNTTTDPNGFAFTRWTLGTTAGPKMLSAVFSGLAPVLFTATATADVPAIIAKNGNDAQSGDNQTGTVGTQLPVALSVKVTDANDNPVENVTVAWTATNGGSVSAPSSQTDATGVARVFRTLGALPGGYPTTAEVTGLQGSPVTFSSTATIGAPNRLVFTTQPGNTVGGQVFSPAITVEVQDAQGNPILTATNSITMASSVTGTLSGTNPVSAVNGVATFTNLSITKAGNGYFLTAFASGLSSAVSQTFNVAKASTTVAVTSDTPDPSVTGQAVTINYDVNVVAPGSGSLTGTVTVTDGTQSCTNGINAGTGQGSCQIAFVSAGTHSLSATYTGDANFNGSTSPVAGHQVQKANTTILITSDLPDSSLVGETVTVNFTLAPNSPGAGSPTGTVTVTVSGGGENCSVDAAAGTCAITLNTAGNRTLTASYGGDANFNSDTDTEAHAVRSPTTTSVTTTNGSSVFGQSVTFTATVAPVSGGGTPGGTVQFKVDGANRDGAVNLSGGTASKTLSDLTAGSHVIEAVYSGSTTFGGSTGTLSPDQQVNQAVTSTALVSNNNPADEGESVTFTATVSSVAPGAGTPTGTVTFLDGVTPIGSGGLNGSGVATFTTSSLTVGPHSITAQYAGAANFAGSTSPLLSQQVDPGNTPPTAVADPYQVDEDNTLAVNGSNDVLQNDSDAEGDPLTAQLVSAPSHHNGVFTLNANGTFSYDPEDDFNGTDSFTYRANDGTANSNTVTVTLTVNPVNDLPSFTKGPDQSVSSLLSLLGVTVPDWATDITPGPNEAGQTVSFNVSTDNAGAFSVVPAVSSDGTLTFTPALTGSQVVVTVTVVVEDNLGATSGSQTFTITIDP